MELGFVDSDIPNFRDVNFKNNRQRKIKERLTITDETNWPQQNVCAIAGLSLSL
jgi:hypothetical protein